MPSVSRRSSQHSSESASYEFKHMRGDTMTKVSPIQRSRHRLVRFSIREQLCPIVGCLYALLRLFHSLLSSNPKCKCAAENLSLRLRVAKPKSNEYLNRLFARCSVSWTEACVAFGSFHLFVLFIAAQNGYRLSHSSSFACCSLAPLAWIVTIANALIRICSDKKGRIYSVRNII